MLIFKLFDRRLPLGGTLEAVPTAPEVIEGLLQLVLLVEDERAVLRNRLVQGLASDEEKASVVFQGGDFDDFILRIVLSKVTGTMLLEDLLFIILNVQSTLEANNHAVPAFWNGVIVRVSFVNGEVNVVGWRSYLDGTFDAEYLTGQNLGFDVTVVVLRDIASRDFLILGLAVLPLPLKIEPELETVELLLKAGWHL